MPLLSSDEAERNMVWTWDEYAGCAGCDRKILRGKDEWVMDESLYSYHSLCWLIKQREVSVVEEKPPF